MSELLYRTETFNIIGACMKVHQTLGNGFLESVYQEALEKELKRREIPFLKQQRLNIYYGEEKLDKYFIADFVCYDKVILEIKAVSYLGNNLTQQVVNYLKSTKMEVGLLINFGEKSLSWKRFINTPYSV
jgi:GxxExxY protein